MNYSCSETFEEKKGKRKDVGFRLSCLLAQHAFCLKYTLPEVNSCGASERAVSAACAVVSVKFLQRFNVNLVECLLDQYWTEFVAAHAHASAASNALELFDFVRRERLCSR